MKGNDEPDVPLPRVAGALRLRSTQKPEIPRVSLSVRRSAPRHNPLSRGSSVANPITPSLMRPVRGLRHGDWSAYARYELPDGRE